MKMPDKKFDKKFEEITVKELEKLPLDERLKKLKKIMSNKKKEIGDIEILFNKSIRLQKQKEDLKEKREKNYEHEINLENNNKFDDSIDDLVGTEKNNFKKDSEINFKDINSIYDRLHNYSEMASKGLMDYNSFNTAIELYNKLNKINEYKSKIEESYSNNEYQSNKQVEEMANSSKRLFKEIFSQYNSITKTYKDQNAP